MPMTISMSRNSGRKNPERGKEMSPAQAFKVAIVRSAEAVEQQKKQSSTTPPPPRIASKQPAVGANDRSGR